MSAILVPGQAPASTPRCKFCGCTPQRACVMPVTGQPCSWEHVDPEDPDVAVCSACALRAELARLSAFSKIEAVRVERDVSGHWFHPALPLLFDENDGLELFAMSHGLELEHVAMSHDAPIAFDRYLTQDHPDCSYWNPQPSPGPGWFLFALYDTESGPFACFARHPEAPALPPAASPGVIS